MSAEREFDDVLAVLERCGPPAPKAELLERIAADVAADAEPCAPEAWFELRGDDAYALLLTLLGSEALAEEALEEAAFRLHRSSGGDPGRFVREASLETLRLLDKAGARRGDSLLDELSPEARVQLLAHQVDLGGAGAERDALRAAIGQLTLALRQRLREACVEQAPILARAAVGQSPAAELERLSEHRAECESCAVASARLEAVLELPFTHVPDREAVSRRVAARLDQDRDLQARIDGVALKVTLQCSFCHGGMIRAEAVFCASCLAPHHGDCFRDHGRCSAIGCEERETIQVGRRPETPLVVGPVAPRRLAGKLLWIGLGGVLSAAAFGIYEYRRDRGIVERMLQFQQQREAYPPQTPEPEPRYRGAPPTDQVAVHLWQRLRNAKIRRDYATWHRLAVEMWHRHSNSPYFQRLELPLPMHGTTGGRRVYVNDVFQGVTKAGELLIATYKPCDLVKVRATVGKETVWEPHPFPGKVYQPLGSLRVGDLRGDEAAYRLRGRHQLDGRFGRYDVKARVLVLQNGASFSLSEALLIDRQLLVLLRKLREGNRIRMIFKDGEVVDVERR